VFPPMPLTGEMFQGPDVVVGEQLSQPAPPVHRQDGGERIELMRPPGFRIDGEGRGRPLGPDLTPALSRRPRVRWDRDRGPDLGARCFSVLASGKPPSALRSQIRFPL
jgi:hypothetical protein